MQSAASRKTIKHLRNSRLFVIAFLIALQILLLFTLSELTADLQILLRFFRLFLVFWILSRQDNASYKISWILLVLFLPLPGGLFYLIFGNKRMTRRMKRCLDAYSQASVHSDKEDFPELSQLTSGEQRQIRYLSEVSGARIHSKTKTVYFSSGELLFQRLLEELKQAKHFVFLEYFIISEGSLWDSVLNILEEKAQSGVEIRILADDAGCITTLPSGFEQKMREKGISFVLFNPLQPRMNTFLNYRDHRKIAVIDGNLAFTGGANLADEYVNLQERHGHWKDVGILLHGPAVENLTELFIQLWQFSTGEKLDVSRYRSTDSMDCSDFVQPFGSDPLGSCNTVKNAYLQLCSHSTDYLYIITPYLILDDETLCTLQTAARSAVDVRIITPHIGDKWYVHAATRSFYLPLLEAGVRIFEYTPGFIHGKMLISDDLQAIIGSANMDFRSFYLQFECGVALYGSPAIQDMRADFLATEEISQEITLETIQQTPLHTRLLRMALRFIAPLL